VRLRHVIAAATFREAPPTDWKPVAVRRRPTLLAAGQITGTEGYAASGWRAGWLVATTQAPTGQGQEAAANCRHHMIGALIHFIHHSSEVGKFSADAAQLQV